MIAFIFLLVKAYLIIGFLFGIRQEIVHFIQHKETGFSIPWLIVDTLIWPVLLFLLIENWLTKKK